MSALNLRTWKVGKFRLLVRSVSPCYRRLSDTLRTTLGNINMRPGAGCDNSQIVIGQLYTDILVTLCRLCSKIYVKIKEDG